MKRIALTCVVALLLTAAVTWAAGTQEGPRSAASSAQTKPVKILMLEVNKSGWEASDNAQIKAFMEEKSGVRFEVINTKDSEELGRKVNLALASQEDIDVVQVTYEEAWLWDLVERGALQPINDALQRQGPNLLKHFSKEEIWPAVTDAQGKIYAIPRRQGNMGNMIAIRRDWREKLGIKTAPKNLAELEVYFRGVRDKDLDGNGQKDTTPVISWRLYSDLQTTVGYLITGVISYASDNYIDEQGRVVPVVMHPKFKDYLARMAQWHKEGILHPEQYNLKKNQVEDLIVANKVGAYAGWYSDPIRPWEKLMGKVKDAWYEFPFFTLENGQKYLAPRRPPGTPGMGVVAYSKNADWAVRLFDWTVANPTNYTVTRSGVPGTHWDWVNESKLEMKDNKDPKKAIYNGAFSITMDSDKYNTKTVAGDPGFVRNMYDEVQESMGANGYIWAPDWFVAYKWKGTPVEVSLSDAATMMQEATTKIIIGQRPLSDWDQIIAQYRKMHADKYIELATQQYKAYKK